MADESKVTESPIERLIGASDRIMAGKAEAKRRHERELALIAAARSLLEAYYRDERLEKLSPGVVQHAAEFLSYRFTTSRKE